MNLSKTLISSVAIYGVGLALYFFLTTNESIIWYSVGGGLALVNVFFAFFAVKKGLQSLKSKPLFLMLLLFKSMTFVLVVMVVLMLLKPLLLPFTLGISVVIVGAVVAALWEFRSARAA